MAFGVLVAVVQQGCQRGGLARPGSTHRQDEAPFEKGLLLEYGRQTQLVERGDVRNHVPHHHAHLPTLHMDVEAKALVVGRGVRQVALHGGFELLALRLAHDGVGHDPYVVRAEHLAGDGHVQALPLDGGRSTRQEKQIGRALPRNQRQTG